MQSISRLNRPKSIQKKQRKNRYANKKDVEAIKSAVFDIDVMTI
jgi:hypothetical protein